MKQQPPMFKVGDRVRICDGILTIDTPENVRNGWIGYAKGSGPHFGTVEEAPKTARGKRFLVRIDGGFWIFGQDCPQMLRLDWLTLA